MKYLHNVFLSQMSSWTQLRVLESFIYLSFIVKNLLISWWASCYFMVMFLHICIICLCLAFLCLTGYHCPTGSADPLPCPVGFYTNSPGQSNCTECTEGSFCNGTSILVSNLLYLIHVICMHCCNIPVFFLFIPWIKCCASNTAANHDIWIIISAIKVHLEQL